MYTVNTVNSFRNQYYYNSFRCNKSTLEDSNKNNNNNNSAKPVAVSTNDNRVNFGDHKASPLVSKMIDFAKKLITGDLSSNKGDFVPYNA